MVDYFGNRYWAQKYWATRYFQGGVLPEGSIEATLSGAATVTATLSRVRVAQVETETYGGRRKWRPKQPLAPPPAIPAMASATITAASYLTATAIPVAVARAALSGQSSMTGSGTVIDNYALEAEFWLIAA